MRNGKDIHLPWGLKRAVLSVLYGRVKCARCGTGCPDASAALAHCYTPPPKVEDAA